MLAMRPVSAIASGHVSRPSPTLPFSSALPPLEREGDIRPQALEHCQVNPEHGQWFKQAGDGQRSGVQHLETGRAPSA